jgi:hypothetical protein
MATVYQVPVPVASNTEIRVQLDGSTFTFRWLWNERDGHWYMSLSDVAGDEVVNGLRVVVGWDLLKDVTSENAPAGSLFFFDESTSSKTVYGVDPGEDDLGDRVFCYYVPDTEVADILAGT